MKRIRRHKVKQAEERQQNKLKKARQPGISDIQRAVENPAPDTLSPDVVSNLQHLHGNRFVSGLTSGSGLTIQPKLKVTPANDKYEQEADAVAADAVSRMHDDTVQREVIQMKHDDAIQRDPIAGEEEEEQQQAGEEPQPAAEDARPEQEPEAEQEEEEEEVQRKAENSLYDGGAITDDLEAQINNERGGGSQLPGELSEKLGAAMGADFSNVRIHTGEKANQLSESIQAKAFTTGNDIFFKDGEYDPGSRDGQELLAHELAHTVQQGAATQRKEDE